MQKKKVLLIDGIPESLKTYSIEKFELLKDFNTCLKKVIFSATSNIIVIKLSDSKER